MVFGSTCSLEKSYYIANCSMEYDSEASRDPRVITSHPNFSQYDLEEGHRACTVYIGLHYPELRRKTHHRRSHRHHHHRQDYGSEYGPTDISKPVTPPSERVHFILGDDENGAHEPHPLFSEMEELFKNGSEWEWRETARWIKFEEDVEEGGNRWSKPHVATVSLHSLFELRSCILNGTILLDMEAHNLEEITDMVLENMVSSNQVGPENAKRIKDIILRRHRHQHEMRDDWSDKGSKLPLIRSLTDFGRSSGKINSQNTPHIWSSFAPPAVEKKVLPENSASTGVLVDFIPGKESSSSFCGNLLNHHCVSEDSSENSLHKMNQAFMRKIPPQAEASNILVGGIDFLDKMISAFVRLNESCSMGDLTEVPLPTRFVFILLGPKGNAIKYHEIGRAMATLLSDEVFHGVAYKSRNRLDLLAGVDEFLDVTTVLPPGVWDPSNRMEPPSQTASQESRKKSELKKEDTDFFSEFGAHQVQNKYVCNKRLFDGLATDIKQKIPWFLSDFLDSLALQSVASTVFIYFACIAQIITFGGLLSHATKQRIAVVESLMSAVVCGVIYALFSGQPLTLLGSTGPILVFESFVFDMCEKHAIDYLSFRAWIGLWTTMWLMLLVIFNLSDAVCYITRFTEEIFATLVSAFFIYKAFKNILQIEMDFPLRTGFSLPVNPACGCLLSNSITKITTDEQQCQIMNGTVLPQGCSFLPSYYVPNIFLMSVVLFVGTLALILLLREVKNTPFFPIKIRTCISNFSVVLAVLIMTLLDAHVGLLTPKLKVPQEFKPTCSSRNWVIPLFGDNSWWTALIALLPALFLTILIFMDQQITAVIVNRKENKLKKGCGYHLDLFIVAILIAICSIFGLPWFVAATVLSMSHVNSLKKVSRCSAPGEKPHFFGVREQRVTHMFVSILVGLSVFFADALQYIPMPVLYGVFLFMGVTSLKGLQFFDRVLLLFMPEKYQPDYGYLRHVPVNKVRLYTLLQIALFALLFCCKLFKMASFAFPFLLLGVVLIRKLLGYLIHETYLKVLEDLMPERTKLNNDAHFSIATQPSDAVLKLVKNDNHCNINISEVLQQSSAWKCINLQSQKKLFQATKNKKKKSRNKLSSNLSERRRLSIMHEEEEEQAPSKGTIV